MPRGQTAEVKVRRERILERLAASAPPVSVRNVFYQMVSFYGYPKTQPFYKRISDDLTALRIAGKVPWSWVTDGSRGAIGATSDENLSAAETVRRHLREARPVTSVWEEHGLRPHIWCESKSAAGMIWEVCAGMEVSLWPSSGQASTTFVYDGAQDLPDAVGILSDWDDAGHHIENSIAARLVRFGARLEQVDRLAVTEKQIADWQLPTRPNTGGKITAVKVELEAIPPDTLRGVVKDWLENLLPPDAWARYETRKKQAAAEVASLVGELEGHIR